MTILSDSFSRTFIGVDFREESLVISLMKNDLSGFKLLSSSTFPVRADDETTGEIKAFISRAGEEGSVYVCVPHSWAIIKFIQVPSAKGKGRNALSQMMRFEIERHIPFQVDDIFYDYQVVDTLGAFQKVMFTAVKRDKIEFLNNFLEKISLKPRSVSLAPFAVFNAIEFSQGKIGGWQEILGIKGRPDVFGRKGDSCLLMHIDGRDAHLAAMKNGVCVEYHPFALEQDMPAGILISDIAARVEELLKGTAISDSRQMIISGYSPDIKELSEGLGEKLGLKIRTINSISGYFTGEEDPQDWSKMSSIGSCYPGVGIGSLKINLLPHESDTETGKLGLIVTKVSVPLILFLIAGIFVGELAYDKRVLMKIEKKLSQHETEIAEIMKLSDEVHKLRAKNTLLREAKESNVILDVLSELTRIIPPEAWLTNLSFGQTSEEEEKNARGELVITGYAESSSVLISILEDSPFFRGVEFVGSITRRQEKEGFKIRAIAVRTDMIEEIEEDIIENDMEGEESLITKGG